MRKIAIAWCCVVAVGSVAAVHGQQPAFKGGVSLVTVDVTVLDREGRPVPGLTANDFQVKLNGKVQPVRALTYLEASTETPESAPAPKGPVMPQMFPVAPVRGGDSSTATESRVFVILVDDLSFAPVEGKALFSATQRFVAGLPGADIVGFATSSGPGVVNPTRDRAPIDHALAKVVGEWFDPRSIDRGTPAGRNAGPDQSLGISQALDIDRGDLTALKDAVARECFNGDRGIFNTNSVEAVIASNQCASDIYSQARRTAGLTRQTTERQARAIQSVIMAMKPATGIKHLLLLTAGVGVTFDASSLEPVARAAADAGIQLSVVIEEPGMSLTDTGRRDVGARGGQPAQQSDTGISQRRRDDNAMFVNGAHTLADMVGGAFYRVIGSPDPFFQRIATASSGIYRLAIEPPGDTAPGQEFSLLAAVKKPGLTTQTHKRALAMAPAAAVAAASAAPKAPVANAGATVDDQLRAAMTAGRTSDGVPIGLASAVRRAADGSQMEMGIRVQIPASAKGPLTAVFGVVDEAGKIRSGRRVIDAPPEGEPYGLTFSVPVTAGAYRLRFAVADASGRVGAVEKPVRADFTAMGPLASGEVQISWTDAADNEQADFPPPEDLPAAAKTLNASLELYQVAGEAAPRDVLVKVAFGPAGQPAAIERIVAPANDNGTWRAEAQFPLDRLAAGAYTVQATVLIDGKVVGTRATSVRLRGR